MAEELEDECDYIKEAEAARRFERGLEGDKRFSVVRIVDELSSKNVLVMERLDGVPIIRALKWSQGKRDEVLSCTCAVGHLSELDCFLDRHEHTLALPKGALHPAVHANRSELE
jgi:predicted unusual protein kinase regulating ubiquinone biosynthesis (AarF/ABC1/UbiB family)